MGDKWGLWYSDGGTALTIQGTHMQIEMGLGSFADLVANISRYLSLHIPVVLVYDGLRTGFVEYDSWEENGYKYRGKLCVVVKDGKLRFYSGDIFIGSSIVAVGDCTNTRFVRHSAVGYGPWYPHPNNRTWLSSF